jgi:hypothetical protein
MRLLEAIPKLPGNDMCGVSIAEFPGCGYHNQVFDSLSNGLSRGQDVTLEVIYRSGP